MRITISPETGEEPSEVVIENVTQFCVVGNNFREKMFKDTFCRITVSRKPELLGLLEMAKEEIREYTMGGRT